MQLYYTSCRRGLLGYGGFQFNAVSPGVTTAQMREVEEATSYQPPGPGFSGAAEAHDTDLPVAFSHRESELGYSITARVVGTGADYSGRPGNYFAHALITDSPADFGEFF